MNKMKVVVAAVGSVLLSCGSALAVLDADQLAVTNKIDTMIADFSAWGWLAVLAVLTFTMGVKIVKKFVPKAV